MSHIDHSRTTDLVHRAQKGDRWASNEMFRRYYLRLLGFVRHRLGCRIRRDVESCDIVQDSLMVAVRKLPDFEVRNYASLMHWLRAIVENQIRDRASWQDAECRRRPSDPCGPFPGRPPLPVDARNGQSPLERLVTKERAESVETRLAQLPARYRDLIRARHHQGLDWDQIAARLGRPSANAARMMYREALTKLGTLLRRHRASE